MYCLSLKGALKLYMLQAHSPESTSGCCPPPLSGNPLADDGSALIPRVYPSPSRSALFLELSGYCCPPTLSLLLFFTLPPLELQRKFVCLLYPFATLMYVSWFCQKWKMVCFFLLSSLLEHFHKQEGENADLGNYIHTRSPFL